MTADSAKRDPGAAADLTERSDKKSEAEPSKRWERRSDARPKELLSAALELFAQRGFAGTRLEDVAAKAGVSKATVYLYFRNKEDLFEALIREAVVPSIEQAEEMLDAYPGPTVDLLKMFVAFFERKLDGPLPALVKLIVAESANFPKLAQLWVDFGPPRRGLALVQRILQRGIDRKELRPFNPEHVAPLVAAPLVMLMIWKQAIAPHTDFRLDPRELLTEHVETLMRGLAERGPTALGEAAASGTDPRMKSPQTAPRRGARRRR
jgi:AcrR family transcriptional regulator